MEEGKGQSEGKTNYMWAYFKPIAILMALVMLPLVVFIFALRFFLVILFTTPFLFLAIVPLYLVYLGLVIYWFFKKSSLYRQWKAAAITYGMQRSKDMMKDLPPETLKEAQKAMMQNESMKQFREELKEEIKKEMQEEARNP
jgi:hypothetical protein